MKTEKIYKNNSKLPLSLHSNLCDNYNVETGGELKIFAKQKFTEAKFDLNSNFKNLREKYDQHKLDRLIGRSLISTSHEIVKGAFEFVSVPSKSSGIGFMLVKGTEKFMNELFEGTLKLYDEQSKLEAEKLIGKHLQVIRDNENFRFENLEGLSVQDASLRIFQSDKGIFDNSISDFEEQDKPYVIYHMSRILEDRMTKALALNQLADAARDLEITDMKSSIDTLKGISRSLVKFQEKTESHLKNINTNLNVIRSNVNELRNEVNKNAKDINILKDFMFNNLDVDEKIRALDQGMRGNPDSAENKKLRLQLEAYQAKKNINEEITEYINGAKCINNITNNLGETLGIDPKFIKKVNDIVNTGAIIANAYLAFNSSGGALAAISQVSNLFGGNSDPASSRHAQIMKRLDIIDIKLDEVINRQKILLENQQKMIYLQMDTLKIIGLMAEDIEDKHQKIMEKLDLIHADITLNREQMLNFAFREFENLKTFIRRYSEGNYKLQNGKIANYNDRIQHWRSYSFAFLEAKKVLLHQLNPNTIGDYIKLESYKGNDEIKEINLLLKTYEVIISFISSNSSLDKVASSGLLSCESISDIERKVKYLVNEISEYSINTALKNKISIVHLEDITELLLKTNDYFLLIKNKNGEDVLMTYEEIYESDISNKIGLDMLKDLEKIINIAIIQENILSGDITLIALYDNLIEEFKSDTTKSVKYDQLTEVLRSNELFKKNFTKYLLKSELRKTKTKLTQYFIALNAIDKDNKILRNMFSESSFKNGIEYIDGNSKYSKGWYIHLPYDKDGQYISLKLPDFTEYDNGRIHYRPEMERLYRLKNKVIDEILDYEHTGFIDSEEQIALSNNLLSL